MLDDLLGYIDDSIYKKAAAYCAYQERCQQEVRDKLYSLKLHHDDVEKIIAKLVRDNFINEERFAITYAGGKFRMKHWGKIKIKLMLQQKKVSAFCINKALKDIDNGDYQKVLKKLITDASKKTAEKNPLKKNHRIAQQIISKGFEPELVWALLGN